ncbi:MAG: efflux RND transporter periplasmic adaptor subunit [Clostridiales Family XIII bacterium]|jgi:multidrug resistance efflux pump|nr:efflux RND transporter periplasmic adaptor subunit [Clostridiales Family XIII bacterium]
MANSDKKILDSDKPTRKLRAVLLPLLLVIVLAGCAAGYYLYNQSSAYFTTDNAKVTAGMYSVFPVKQGQILEWNIAAGDEVKKNQILGCQDVLPYITSPIDGLVVKSDAAVGQNASMSAPLAVIADTSDMYIGVNIEETDITRIKPGQHVSVSIDAYKGKTFRGIVTEVDQTTQTYFSNSSSFSTSGTYTKVTQLVPVKVYIENPEGLPLTYGMNATVKIRLTEAANETPLVTVEMASRANASDNVYVGNVEAGKTFKLSSDISGKVSAVDLSIGDTVLRDDLLFTIDSADFSLQFDQADAAYRAALTSYENSRALLREQSSIIPSRVAYDEAVRNYENLSILFAEGAVSQSELDGAKARMDSAEAQWKIAATQAEDSSEVASAQLDNAKAALEIARQRLNNCQVKSPIDAEVLSVNINPGDMISPQTIAVTLIDASEILVKINVTESRVGQIFLDKPVEIRLPATGSVIAGTVSSISPGLDPATGMFTVEISAANGDRKANVGMTADIRFEDSADSGGVAIPTSAVRNDDGGRFVYIAVPADAAGSGNTKAAADAADSRDAKTGTDAANAKTGTDAENTKAAGIAALIEKRYLSGDSAGIKPGEWIVTQSTGALYESAKVSCIVIGGQK